ncbi:MAG: argininosuccinate lyase [Desulfomonilaceae bacterium]
MKPKPGTESGDEAMAANTADQGGREQERSNLAQDEKMMARPNKDKPNDAAATGVRRGRFETEMDKLFSAFNSSVSFDQRLYPEDIAGSIAHVKMLRMQKIISAKEARLIEKGLLEVQKDIESGKIIFRDDLEDVHINIEEALRTKIGDVAGKLHTARSRNDQVALDLRLYLKKKIEEIKASLVTLMTALVAKADETKRMIMPGYTHLQRAQPVRLGHHLMAYFQMFKRDWTRLTDCCARCDETPLGAAALAGTTFRINREYVAENLAFSSVCANSMDAVSDRDFVAEFIFCASMIMMHLSRLSEEMILWSSSEFGFCTLPDEFCSASSIMPQKKNPDACELIRGKTGRVYGDLVAILAMLKSLPLTYNKDLQEDKEPLFDAVDTVESSIKIMSGLMPGVVFSQERMWEAASEPAMAATDIADRLVRSGMSFRDAHALVGGLVREGKLAELARLAGDAGLPSPEDMVEARKHTGGTALRSVEDQIRAARAFLKEHTPPKNAKKRERGNKSRR